ncbi:hypothetical protein [Methanocalculus sp.]|uniref:hypothetical protein n=1 Tax=Methanocalculus sp. TaxID=2004547 RepID=UPI0017F27825|nr:hypothetical protein [Methanocalculus sp.]HIJ06565.1 hypothetical protein [Methanocalculus sp.]
MFQYLLWNQPTRRSAEVPGGGLPPVSLLTKTGSGGAEAAGYTVTSIMRLPMKTWEGQYRPVAARINEWREICGSRNNRIPAGYGKEIEIFGTYGSYYGYTFFTLKKD